MKARESRRIVQLGLVLCLSLVLLGDALLPTLVAPTAGSPAAAVQAQPLATPTPPETADPAAPPSGAPPEPTADGAEAERGSPRLGSGLRELIEAHRRGALSPAAAQRGARVEAGRVKITVEAEPGQLAGLLAALWALGATPTARYRDQVDVLIPAGALASLESVGALRRADLPIRPHPVDLPTGPAAAATEGLTLLNVPAWQAAGIRGAGVKVAIVDLGFQGYTGLLGSSLPATVDTSCSQNPAANPLENGESHGTAVAEVVHAVAPDAELLLVNIQTATEMGQAVSCLVARGVSVVNHSVTWMYHAPGDGTGIVNEIVASATGQGIFWANAAGNSAQNHWSGIWRDVNFNRRLEFSGSIETQRITLGAGEVVVAGLRWDDPWGSACNDYDLYLWNTPYLVGVPVASSTSTQNCQRGSVPLEVLAYSAPIGGSYYLEVRRRSGVTANRFDLMTFSQPLQFRVTPNSLFHPADSASDGMVSVGAVYVGQPTTLESFSSQGPTTDNRIKPDVAAPDGVSSTVYGSFFGTSAASPHAAGAAALVKSANPGFTPAQIKSFLAARATDLGPAGADNQFGSGRLWLGQPPSTPIGTTPTATASATATGTASAIVTSTATGTATATPTATGTSTATPTATGTATSTPLPTRTPTATGSPTRTPTAIATASATATSTATAPPTPTATATAATGGNLLPNPSFEAGATVPDGWQLVGGGDGDGLATALARSGRRSFRLSGGTSAKRLVTEPPITRQGCAGDTLTLSGYGMGWGYGNFFGGGWQLRLTVAYTDGTTGTAAAPFSLWSSAWWQQASTRFTAAKPYTSLTVAVELSGQPALFTTYTDDLSLTVTGAACGG